MLSDSVKIILNGYKRINCEINYKTINKNLWQYYEVYNWIYGEGNSTDKVGLARNIISLLAMEDDIVTLSSKLMPSIESAHAVYLKENVKEYVEVKK